MNAGVVMIYTIDEIKEKIKPIAKKYDVVGIYLFGSYARGEADENSDVDIAIVKGDTDYIYDYFYTFKEELETVFCLKFDILFSEDVHVPIGKFENRFALKYERDKLKVV